jgi:H+-transporting ATPase
MTMTAQNTTQDTKKKPPEQQPQSRPPAEVVKELGTDLDHGLTAAAVKERAAKYGPNAIAEKTVSPLLRLLRYFWGPIPWMIEAAAGLSLILGDWSDFAIIMTMLFVNAGVGFWEENKADIAIQLLKRRLAPSARVLRDGTWQTLPASALPATSCRSASATSRRPTLSSRKAII